MNNMNFENMQAPQQSIDAIKNTEYHEVLELPSGAFGYTNIPARLSIRPIKADEEKLMMTNPDINKIKTLLLNRCILDKINSLDLYEGDRDYILFRLRAMSYSSMYKLSDQCIECKKKVTLEIDLDALEVKTLKSVEDLTTTVTLPSSGHVVTIKHLIGRDTEVLARKARQDKEDAYLQWITSRITHIEGIDDFFMTWKSIVAGLIGKDSVALRDAIQKHNFGIMDNYFVDCPNCGAENKIGIEVSEEFFRPTA